MLFQPESPKRKPLETCGKIFPAKREEYKEEAPIFNPCSSLPAWHGATWRCDIMPGASAAIMPLWRKSSHHTERAGWEEGKCLCALGPHQASTTGWKSEISPFILKPHLFGFSVICLQKGLQWLLGQGANWGGSFSACVSRRRQGHDEKCGAPAPFLGLLNLTDCRAKT